MWLKQAKEIKQCQQDEFLSGRQEDEMEMSDDDDSGGPSASKKSKRPDVNEYATNQYVEMASRLALVNNLKDENDELKCQLEVYKNEVAVLKQETGSSSTDREKEVRSLQMAMQGMQQQLITARNEHMEYKKRLEQEKSSLLLDKQIALEKYENLRSENLRAEKLRSEQQGTTSKDKDEGESQTEEKDKVTDQSSKVADDTISSTGIQFSDKEAQLVGLVCCFLHVHPTGASIDYIWSYLHRLGVSCRVSELETLLEKIPVIFRQELSGVGATIERRWHFTGYKNLSPAGL